MKRILRIAIFVSLVLQSCVSAAYLFSSASSQDLRYNPTAYNSIYPDMTLHAWFKTTSVAAEQCIFYYGSDGHTSRYSMLWVTTTPGVRARWYNSSAYDLAATTTYTPNEWACVTAVYESDYDMRVYLNGTNKNTGNAALAYSLSADTISVGSRYTSSPGLYANAYICMCSMWTTALSDEDVALLTTTEPNQVESAYIYSYYPLLIDGDLTDHGIKGYDLTAYNSPVYYDDNPLSPISILPILQTQQRRRR